VEKPAIEGDSPLYEKCFISAWISQVQRDTRNLAGICGDHAVRLNRSIRPIVNQYREGKAKRTPMRGVK
jgi:hypothetical protein